MIKIGAKGDDGDPIRRMTWQAAGAAVAIVVAFVGLVRWAVEIESRTVSTRASLADIAATMHNEIGTLDANTRERFAQVTAAITDGNLQREKNADRIEARMSDLTNTLNRLLMPPQGLPLRRTAIYGQNTRDDQIGRP